MAPVRNHSVFPQLRASRAGQYMKCRQRQPEYVVSFLGSSLAKTYLRRVILSLATTIFLSLRGHNTGNDAKEMRLEALIILLALDGDRLKY